MTHLVRNAIAHGIESEATRTTAGKNAVGSIWTSAQASDAGPVITVEDDGDGIDLDGVLERARALGLEGGEATDLIFHAGLSTRAESDGLAGRGVGLDAVRAYLHEAGYTVQVVTERGSGTKFVLAPLA
jgi:chemotaxis protein histidine kinase CheA